MARQPKQVHVYLYRRRNDRWEYAIFQRSDMPVCWQGVSGGVEDDETFEQAACRETAEEAGVQETRPVYPLDTVSCMRADVIRESCRKNWGPDVIVIPIRYFAMPYDGEITLSHEHTEVRWLPFEEAYSLVYFLNQKTALYELNERLLRGLLRRNDEEA